MADTMKDYAKHIRTKACFDTLIEVKKAIKGNDDATALVALGELREQLTFLSEYINSLEKSAQPRE